jgi:hypothetical protein
MQSQPLTINVKVEKTGKAYVLEKKLDISWDIARHFDFDAGYDVRAAIYEPLTIFSRKFEVIPIGLKFEIQDPYKYFDWFLLVISISMTIFVYVAHGPYFYLFMSLVYIVTMFLLIKALFDFNNRMKRWLKF